MGIKKIFSITTAVLLITVISAPVGFSKDAKIGCIDSRLVLQNYEKAKNFESEMETFTKQAQSDRQAKIDDLRKLQDEAQIMTGDAKKKKLLELEGKRADLNEYDWKTRQELLNKQNEMFRELTGDINDAVEKIAKKDGYDYIFDTRSIIYKKPEFDLTDEVIKALGKK